MAAALLKSRGLDVVGVTLKLWPGEEGCCSATAADDARRVAGRLGIPHYVLDMTAEFRREVVEPFIRAYRRGLTPNPCILCNERIKFGALFRKAFALEATHVATGHYARCEQDPSTGRYLLRRALDDAKDQSYVLYVLGQQELARVYWPLGELTKVQVRRLAEALDRRVATRQESQEICFVGPQGYAAFIAALDRSALRPGPVYHVDGRLLGTHRGLPFYTVGQRRGLGISWPRPLYVVRLDPDSNAVIVGSYEDLRRDGLIATAVNLIAVAALEEPLEVAVKLRYGRQEHRAVIRSVPAPAGQTGIAVEVRFHRPAGPVSPGQAAVFYRGDVVVGGGTIHAPI